MGVTVSEARKRTCVSCIRLCTADACMAWRWDEGKDPQVAKSGILLPRSLWPGHCGLVKKEEQNE